VGQTDKKLGYETQAGIIILDKKQGNLTFKANENNVEKLCKLEEENCIVDVIPVNIYE